MHQWVVLKNNIKIYIKIYTKTAPTPFGVTDTNLYVLLCLQWKPPDDVQRNCPKHVQFYSENKFEKLMHLVGFIIRMDIGFLFLYWEGRMDGQTSTAILVFPPPGW